MIECTRCLTWVHLKCAKLTRQRIPETWFCQRCKSLKGNDALADRKMAKKNIKGKKSATLSKPTFGEDEKGFADRSRDGQTEGKTDREEKKGFADRSRDGQTEGQTDREEKVTGSRKRKLTSRRRKITSETPNDVTTFSQLESTKSRRLSFEGESELSNDA